jgi:hypothetical protein
MLSSPALLAASFDAEAERLQAERIACVERLLAIIEQARPDADIETHLQRIETINAELIELATRNAG